MLARCHHCNPLSSLHPRRTPVFRVCVCVCVPKRKLPTAVHLIASRAGRQPRSFSPFSSSFFPPHLCLIRVDQNPKCLTCRSVKKRMFLIEAGMVPVYVPSAGLMFRKGVRAVLQRLHPLSSSLTQLLDPRAAPGVITAPLINLMEL